MTCTSIVVRQGEVRQSQRTRYSRKRIARLAVEYRSHGLDDAIELYQLQLEVEQVIADEFPDEFWDFVVDWAEQDAEARHYPLSGFPDCTLCTAIALDEAMRSTWPHAA